MQTEKLDELIVAKNFKKANDFFDEEYERLRKTSTPISRFIWAEHAARLQIPKAINAVYGAYRKGDGCEPSPTKAFEWLKHGASLNEGERFYQDLALAYRDGDGTQIDIPKFWSFMTKAAEAPKGREAMFHLAMAHRDRSLGKLSKKRAFYWTKRTAKEGSAGGMTDLAIQHLEKGEFDHALEWAKKAVRAAEQDLAASPTLEASSDWANEDYPAALEVLAKAHSKCGLASEPRTTDLKVAEAAWHAIEQVLAKNEPPGTSLIGSMLRAIRHHPLSGDSGQEDHPGNFLWLSRIGRGVTGAQGNSSDSISLSSDLSNAILELARAHGKGIGTPINRREYRVWLKKAADWGSSDAAYDYAILHRLKDDDIFSTYITKATNAGDNTQAFIAKSVNECCPGKAGFKRYFDLLTDIWTATKEIREKKHEIEVVDTTPIAHYTTAEGLKKMLGTKTGKPKNHVRLYNVGYMNDPHEGKRLTAFQKSDTTYKNPLTPFFKERKEDDDTTGPQWQNFSVFLGSFSLDKDGLNLWRFYGSDGAGFSIVTPLKSFSNSNEGSMAGAWADRPTSPSPVRLFKVLYHDADAEYALSQLTPSLNALNKKLTREKSDSVRNAIGTTAVTIVSELMYLYKHAGYESEKEVRAIQARSLGSEDLKQQPVDKSSFSKLYIETAALLFEFEGSEVIIGPKVNKADSVMLNIRHQLARMDWSDCKVRHSLLPYR